MKPKILALGLAVLCISAHGADLIPVEDFARYPTHSDLQLSQDGRYVAALRSVDGRNFIEFIDLANGTAKKFDPGAVSTFAPGSPLYSVSRYYWLGSKRVLYEFGDGSAAVDLDGGNWKPISGRVASANVNPLLNHTTKEYLVARRPFHAFNDDVHALLHRHAAGRVSMSRYPEAIKMNTATGTYDIVVDNPGQVVSWLADGNGVVRIGVQEKSPDDQSLIYRQGEESPWQPLAGFPNEGKELPIVHGFSSDGRGIYVAATNSEGFRALHLFELAGGRLSEALFAEPGFDVGLSDNLIWSGDKKTVLGCVYETDGPHIKCFDEAFAKNMAAIDSRLSETFNRPVSISADGWRMLILASSDRHPGAYYLFATDTGKIEPILRRRPWLDPERMAPMNPISYTTRDGLAVRGYLTIPVGQKPRNLPLVVLPHEGLFRSRSRWGFDPLVQMLASRGFAVLQINYRGSLGFGEAFLKSGEHQGAGAIQHDIEDAVRWAIAKKVADPKRIAIVGNGRFAGFSALHALAHSPGLYRCGVSISGVIDWLDVDDNLNGDVRDDFRHLLNKTLGDPKTDRERLAALSPVNFADRIGSPVLFVYREKRPLDQDMLPSQAKKMAGVLKKNGVLAEVYFFDSKSDAAAKAQVERFKAVEAFLAEHLGSGVVAQAASAEPAIAEEK